MVRPVAACHASSPQSWFDGHSLRGRAKAGAREAEDQDLRRQGDGCGDEAAPADAQGEHRRGGPGEGERALPERLLFPGGRQPGETMQQYIVRREQDLKRLEEVLPGSAIPDHLRALMLLVFGGLDRGEQMAILASVGNDYDFKKIGHALRIQFPNLASKPVHRRDYLGCGRAGSPSSPQKFRPRPPQGQGQGEGAICLCRAGRGPGL